MTREFKHYRGLALGDRCHVCGNIYYDGKYIDVDSDATLISVYARTCIVKIDTIGDEINCVVKISKKLINLA
jgi:hypothetical protein